MGKNGFTTGSDLPKQPIIACIGRSRGRFRIEPRPEHAFEILNWQIISGGFQSVTYTSGILIPASDLMA
jgi:hypothetical protein